MPFPPFPPTKPAHYPIPISRSADIIEARRAIFGIVPGNGKRSGRKVLRRNLYGPAVRGYYPVTMADLRLDKSGLYSPKQEEYYRCVCVCFARPCQAGGDTGYLPTP